ncbi:MAG: hypothetical protein WAS21_22710 [Geminicoccaceae bacterium]
MPDFLAQVVAIGLTGLASGLIVLSRRSSVAAGRTFDDVLTLAGGVFLAAAMTIPLLGWYAIAFVLGLLAAGAVFLFKTTRDYIASAASAKFITAGELDPVKDQINATGTGLIARLDKLETAVNETSTGLAPRLDALGPTVNDVTALVTRIHELETAVNKATANMVAKLGELDVVMNDANTGLAPRLNALGSTVPEVTGLVTRLAALEKPSQ